MAVKKIEGILVPLVTSFLQNEDLDIAGIEKNVRLHNRSLVAGLFVLGSNGEAAHLSDAEQEDVLRATRAAMSPDKLFIAGITRQSAHATIEFGKRAQEYGADYFSVLTPSYFAPSMSDGYLIEYYVKVADALETPILLYNCPKFAAGITLSCEVVKELSNHPNIAGMKDTSSMPIEDYLKYQTDDFAVISGSINNVVKALDNGSKGGVLSISNFLPDETSEICSLYAAGDHQQAIARAESLISLNKKISGVFGVAGVKCACDLLGFSGGAVRSPLRMPDDKGRESVRQALVDAGYLG